MLRLLFLILIPVISFSTPVIDIVYPRPAGNDTLAFISKVDSNFIFGSVKPPNSKLLINNFPVETHANGSFLSFLPVDWTHKQYEAKAFFNNDSSYSILHFDTRSYENISLEEPNYNFPMLLTFRSRGVARTHPKGAYYLFPLAGTN